MFNSLFRISEEKVVPELELYLAKPDKTTIGNLSSSKDRVGTFSFGRYNEIKFTIPKHIYRKHEKVENKHYFLVKERYLIRAEYGEFSEWMIITGINQSKGRGTGKEVTAKSLQYEMHDKRIYEYKVESYTPRKTMLDTLGNTNWKLGHIDMEFDALYRAFDETNTSALQMLYNIAETFEGVLQFDTFKREVSLYKQENTEIDKGFTASYGKYLKEVSQTSDGESMVTRLHVYGQDNLSINTVNPTGVSYLDDFSYFMLGYKEDDNGNVISSADYMSDSLCGAIVRYNKLLTEKDGIFRDHLKELEERQVEEAIIRDEMSDLVNEILKIEDQLDINKAMEYNVDDLNIQKAEKQAEIDEKQSEIDAKVAEKEAVESSIKSLREEFSQENNFTEAQVKEMQFYIVEDEWVDRNYIDARDLYEAGRDVLKKSRQPKRDLEFSLIQFLEVVESYRDWDKIGLGYVVRMDYEPQDIEIRALVTEMSIGFDSRTLDISLSNVDYKSDKKAFAELLYGTAISTSQRVDAYDFRWNENTNKVTEINEILQNAWDAANRRIIAGVDETVDISRRGIRITSPLFPEEVIIMQSGVIALSKDAGLTWSTAITPHGMVRDKVAKVIIRKRGNADE